jgi:hypothetical protein
LAVYVGQVVPLVAAAIVVSWRLARQDRDVAAGLVLSLVALKPNTAILVPFVLLAAGRWRIFVTWAAASAVFAGVSALALGFDGTRDYLEALGNLPHGATALTLDGAFGLTGTVALVCRLAIVAAAMVIGRMLRATPGVGMAAGAIASLLVAPYLHNSDLCVLVAAGWMLWEEAPLFRIPLLAMWLAALPYVLQRWMTPVLDDWARIELALFAALIVFALARGRLLAAAEEKPLTAPGDLGTRAPA